MPLIKHRVSTLLMIFIHAFIVMHLQASVLSAQIREFTYEITHTDSISSGIIHYKIVEKSVPWTLNVLKIDLSKPEIRFNTVKAKDQLRAYEKTSDMLSRSNTDDIVYAAVNGDFYRSGGIPIGAQISMGELVKSPDRPWHLFSITEDNQVDFSFPAYEGTVEYSIYDSIRNESLRYKQSISNVNPDTATKGLIYVYNRFYESELPNDEHIRAFILEPLEHWMVNKPVKSIITAVKEEGGFLVPKMGDSLLTGLNKTVHPFKQQDVTEPSVLVYTTTEHEDLNRLTKGDTLTIHHRLHPGLPSIYSAVGGNQQILTNGVFTGDWPERHPRTAVGINADTSNVYFITVDGRQEASMGMTLRELAEFMQTLKITQAMNLDGGGSTTMVVRDKVVNLPSDKTGERTVSNALMVIQKKPAEID